MTAVFYVVLALRVASLMLAAGIAIADRARR